MNCDEFLVEIDEKRRLNGEVCSILLQKVFLSLPGFQDTGNCLSLLCGVLVYQISQESFKKDGDCGWENHLRL